MPTTTQGRTGRPRVQTLDNVVTQAIALVDEEGAAGLTMSALARRLGVGTMTLYGYVPSRESLVDLMVARLLEEQPAVPVPDPVRWIDSVVDYMGLVRAWAMQRPALFHLRQERPRLTDEVARRVQADLDALTQLGFTPQEAITLRHTLNVQLEGQLEFELLRRQPETGPAGRASVDGTLSEALAHLQAADQAELYATGVRAVLVGFATLLAGR